MGQYSSLRLYSCTFTRGFLHEIYSDHTATVGKRDTSWTPDTRTRPPESNKGTSPVHSSTETHWSEEAERFQLQLPLLQRTAPRQPSTSQTSEQHKASDLITNIPKKKQKVGRQKFRVSVSVSTQIPSEWSS